MRDLTTSGNIVDLRCAMRPETQSSLDDMRRYWQAARRDGDIPRRADIDPRGISDLLEHAMIIEKIAPGLARMRIAGQQLNDLLGMEVRGMPISAFIAPDHRDQLADALNDLFERPAILTVQLSSPGGFARPALRATLLLMPLRSDLGDVSRALGCLVSDGQSGRRPRRFNIDGLRVDQIQSTSNADYPRRVVQQPKAPRAAAPKSGDRSYLKLVTSDESDST